MKSESNFKEIRTLLDNWDSNLEDGRQEFKAKLKKENTDKGSEFDSSLKTALAFNPKTN